MMSSIALPAHSAISAFARVRDDRGQRWPRARAALWLTLAFWGSNYALLTLGTALSGNDHLLAISGMRILTAMLGLGFCYLIHRLLALSAFSTNRRRLILLAFVAPVAAEIFAWASFFAEAVVDPSLSLGNFTWSGAVRTIAFWTWFFLAWSGLYLALMYSFDIREEQARASELKELAHAAQLQALHRQINPHFLFNSLNSVSALILEKNLEAAENMVVKLARFLRLGLSTDPAHKIPLGLEVELQRSYLEIEQLRYPDLSVAVSLPTRLECALVPSLILQPLIENAVKHGVAGTPPPSVIGIEATAANRYLELRVVDSGNGTSQSAGAGIGLANVRQRLSLLYGDGRFAFTAGRASDGHFEVRMSIPLEMA